MTTITTLPRAVATNPSSLQVFAACMRSEWTKLRTIRSAVFVLFLTAAIIAGVGILIVSLEVGRWDQRTAVEQMAFDPVLYAFAGMNLAQMCIGTMGILRMTSEYSSGVIKLSIAATPQRHILLAAKVATFALVTTVVAVVACVPTFFICQAILASESAGVSIADPGILRALLGTILFLVLVGTMSIALGAIIRNTAAGVALLFSLFLIIPGLVTLLPSPIDNTIYKYLPGSAGASMAAVTSSADRLGPLAGSLVFVAYIVVLLVAAGVLLSKRDA